MPKWIYSPLSAIILTLIGISILVSLQKTDEQLAQSAVVLEQMRSQVQLLEEEVAESSKNSEIATSAANKERIIRDELLQKKPGEYVVQLPNLEELYPEFDVDLEESEDGKQKKSKNSLEKKQKALEAWKMLLL